MTELITLGTAAAIPSVEHHNTHLALVESPGVILVDCGGMPTVRLAQAGIDPNHVSDIILTHFHPDHVGGLPLLLMNMWLMGRKQALRIYGLHHSLERVEDLMGFYHWEDWPGFFPVAFHRLPEQEKVMVLEREDLIISSTPVCHIVPTIGLRFEFTRSQFSLAYSSDTEPCQTMRNLAQGVDILIHEATGPSVGHSTARQAAELATQAGVKALYLIHYPVGDDQNAKLLAEARESFSGRVECAQDLMRISIP